MKESKILVVDDEPFTRQLMCVFLQRQGFRNVVGVDSGEAALSLLGMEHGDSDELCIMLSQTDIDLVILDVVLPGLNGFEVCQRIKEFDVDLPVILLTSLTGDENRTNGVIAGADAFEQKPINHESLFGQIKKLLFHKDREDKIIADYETLKHLHKTLPPYILKETDKIGEYEVIKTLGNGATSIVYEVKKENSVETLALKILNSKEMHSPDSISLFRQEILNISQLDHRGIVPLFDHGIHVGFPYYVMGKVSGRDLAWEVDNNGPLPFDVVLRVARELAAVLDYVHNEELIHRDVKLENILLSENGDVKLTDFGLSIDANNEHNDLSMIVGTPLYLAPEIIIGRGESAKIDTYSYGIVLYLILTGQAPFEETDVNALLHHHCNTIPQRVETVRPEIPPAWGDLVEACLHKNPKKRPGKLLEFTKEFRFLQYAEY